MRLRKRTLCTSSRISPETTISKFPLRNICKRSKAAPPGTGFRNRLTSTAVSSTILTALTAGPLHLACNPFLIGPGIAGRPQVAYAAGGILDVFPGLLTVGDGDGF